MLLKFDLSAVKGNVQSATLSLQFFAFYTLPIRIAVDYLDMPPLIDDPANQGYPVQHGIAAGVANEQALASHPDVLVYTNPTSLAAIQQSFYVNPALISYPRNGGIRRAVERSGLTAIRVCRARRDNPTPWSRNHPIIRADRWFQPKLAQASRQRPISATVARDSPWFDEMYLRFIIEVGTDVKSA